MEFISQHDEERDWAELNSDMIHLVSKKLPDLRDFIQFHGVCKPWQSATPLADPPSYLPWIFSRSLHSNEDLNFYSLTRENFRTIHVAESSAKELIGPAQNYIFSSDTKQSSFILLNPFTRKHVTLPPLNLHWCFPISNTNNNEYVAICGGNADSEYQTLGFCRPVDDTWIQIEKSLQGCLMIYFQGAYFVYNPANGKTEIINVTTGTVMSVIPPAPKKLEYLVESSGELLGISCVPDHGCEIYRVERVNESSCWVRMSSIGDRVLFLDRGQGFSIKAGNSDKLEGNCIYYLGHHESVKVEGTCTTYHLFRYKIGGERWEKLSIPLMEEPTWFLPSLQ